MELFSDRLLGVDCCCCGVLGGEDNSCSGLLALLSLEVRMGICLVGKTVANSASSKVSKTLFEPIIAVGGGNTDNEGIDSAKLDSCCSVLLFPVVGEDDDDDEEEEEAVSAVIFLLANRDKARCRVLLLLMVGTGSSLLTFGVRNGSSIGCCVCGMACGRGSGEN